VAGGELLAPAGDQQQGVVDGHAQADQGDQELHDDADLGELGQPEDDQEAGQDRHRGDQQGHQGQQGAEHERQYRQRPQGAEQGLGQHPGTVGVAAGGQLLQPADLHGPARRETLAQRAGERWAEVGAAHLGGAGGGEYQPVAGTPVGGQQAPVAGAGVGDDPQARLAGELGEGAAERLPGGRGLDAGAWGWGDDRDQRQGAAAGAVGAQDRLVGRVAGLAGQVELRRQAAGDRGAGRQPGDRHRQPEQDHQPLVPQDEGRQSGHGLVLLVLGPIVQTPAKHSH
jgi:hypothetical protein